MFPEIMMTDAQDRGILPPPIELAWDRARIDLSNLLANGTEEGRIATENNNLEKK